MGKLFVAGTRGSQGHNNAISDRLAIGRDGKKSGEGCGRRKCGGTSSIKMVEEGARGADVEGCSY